MPELYHFSEESGLMRFEPRVAPTSSVTEPLVWAVDAEHAHLYLFPRDCPRVCFTASEQTSPGDIERFLGFTAGRSVVAIESAWLGALRSTTLYRYEMPDDGFECIDTDAGYWTNREMVVPRSFEPVGDLLDALTGADVEVRIMPSLWPLRDAVIASTLQFSIIRWRNALRRPADAGI